ncbi:MAG: hypothetical protein RM049_31665 [Nostoc sp. DedQUE04]|uniref:hypothetical protein n=1 Tax=Nostoc sp. DedQUE04 TaxID=3075390 RepID=UPI002AD467D7|nr:hypothetical protein [Nostoc sp. DedQUE04]MDZ8139795.1 hypothetical protein [Nostoc sp. DedQUE04]
MMNKPPRRRKKATSGASADSASAANSAKEDISQQEDPGSATITVTAVEIPELTEDEQRDRLHLERRVEKAVFEAGKALMELRDRRLYRSTHGTFEEYCKDRFGFQRRHPYRLIEASAVFDNLMKMCPNGTQTESESGDGEMCPIGTQTENEQMCPIGTQILPTSERQVRPLVTLEAEVQRNVWQQAVEQAGNKVPSARIVSDVVQRIMERTQVPNTYQLGEVCQILAKDNPELRGKGGCWGIINNVGQFSCTIKTWDGEYTVGLQHLKSYNYLPAECEQMRVICDRISRLRENENLEEAAHAVLKHLGELKRPYLTAVEEKLLGLIEREYRLLD